jgi:hypothetical protein
LLGGLLLLVLVVFVFKTGLVYESRDEQGLLKKRMSRTGLITIIGVLLLVVLFFFCFDWFAFQSVDHPPFLIIVLLNGILLLLLDLFDALVIDIVVLGMWKPVWLKLPEQLTQNSMWEHVKKQWTVGWIIKIPLLFLVTGVFVLTKSIVG